MSLQSVSEKLVFGARPVVLAVFAAITVAMVFFAMQLKVDAGFEKQIDDEAAFVERRQERARQQRRAGDRRQADRDAGAQDRADVAKTPIEQTAVSALEAADKAGFLFRTACRQFRQQIGAEHGRQRDRGDEARQDRDDVR